MKKNEIDDTVKKMELCDKLFGPPGRIVTGSKVSYIREFRGHKVFFNGIIFDSQANKLWYGDVDVTLDLFRLQGLANKFNEKIFVTAEHPYRFDPPSAQDLEQDSKVVVSQAQVVVFKPESPSNKES